MSCMVPGSYDSSIYIFISFISTAQSKETANTIKKKSSESFEDLPDEDKEKIKNYCIFLTNFRYRWKVITS